MTTAPSPSSFAVDGSVADGVARVAPSGDLDLASLPELERAIARADDTGADVIMLDLRGLTFMDSQGVRCVTDAHDRMRERGNRMVIIEGRSQLRRLVEICRPGSDLPLI
jgi:anti-sigma B factor antagonist